MSTRYVVQVNQYGAGTLESWNDSINYGWGDADHLTKADAWTLASFLAKKLPAGTRLRIVERIVAENVLWTGAPS